MHCKINQFKNSKVNTILFCAFSCVFVLSCRYCCLLCLWFSVVVLVLRSLSVCVYVPLFCLNLLALIYFIILFISHMLLLTSSSCEWQLLGDWQPVSIFDMFHCISGSTLESILIKNQSAQVFENSILSFETTKFGHFFKAEVII